MATADGVFFKELHKLARHVHKMTTGQGAIEFDPDVEEKTFTLSITPNDGHYKGATCKFKIDVPVSYPQTPPLVNCLTNIYHPNIDSNDGSNIEDSERCVCVNLLDEDWQPGVGLDGTVMALLFIFHNPNFGDALNTAFSGNNDMTEEEIHDFVRASLKGKEVEGVYYDALIEDEEEVKCEENTDSKDTTQDSSQSNAECVSVSNEVEGVKTNNESIDGIVTDKPSELESVTTNKEISVAISSVYVTLNDSVSVDENEKESNEKNVDEMSNKSSEKGRDKNETNNDSQCVSTENHTDRGHFILNVMDLPSLSSEELEKHHERSCLHSLHRITILNSFGRLYRWMKILWSRTRHSRQIHYIDEEKDRQR